MSAFDPAAQWSALLDTLRTYGEGTLDHLEPELTDAERAEAVRYLLRFLAAGIAVCVAHDDTETPELGRMTENRVSWGLDNPDCLYSYTRVRAGASYVVRGALGTATHAEIQVNTGHFGDGNFAGWKALGAVAAGDLITDAGGAFALWIGAPPPPDAPPHLANHLPLPPAAASAPDEQANFLLFRQYFGDWANEVPAAVVIDNTDVVLPPAPLSGTHMVEHLALLQQWLTVGAACWRDISRGILGSAPGPITPFLPPASASGLKGQAYGMGSFRCASDEAVILSFTPPPARLWGLSLCDRFWQSIDFAAHQSSLNSYQATVDGDGRFVGVISHDDPGIANWLDPAGATAGTLALRYLFVDQEPPDELPALEQRVVPRAALADELPAGVARVDAAHRHEILSERRAAVSLRYHR